MTITFINNYDAVLKNDSLSDRLVTGLIYQISNLLEIKSKRVSYATVATSNKNTETLLKLYLVKSFLFLASSKTVFHFIIQQTTTASKERNAEVAAFYLKDQIFYGDNFLTDLDGAQMDIDTEAFDIIQTENLPGKFANLHS